MHLLALALLWLPLDAPAPAPAPARDSTAVSAAVHAYIDAMMTRDTAYLRRASLPQARVVSVTVPGDTVTIRSLDEFVVGIGRATRRFVGRVWSPRISIAGGIAVYVAPYDAWYDGRFSHCGIDHYVLVRRDGRWLVHELIYTRQLEGCTPSPLGPPP